MKNPQDIPTIEESLAVLAEVAKVVHQALDLEYQTRRDNLRNANVNPNLSAVQTGIQNDVRFFASSTKFDPAQLAVIRAVFAAWKPTPKVREVHLPVIY